MPVQELLPNREPTTAPQLQRTERKAATLIGKAPLTLAIDMSKTTTHVRASRGGETVGKLEFPTPDTHQNSMVSITAAKNTLVGLHQHPDTVGVSVEKVAKGGQTKAAEDAGESFKEAVAAATGLPNDEDVIVLDRDSARAVAESILYPAAKRDGTYLRWNNEKARLKGAAVYTPEGWIIPHEPDKNVRGSLVTVMDHTFTTFREAGLDVARAAFTGVEPRQLGKLDARLQEKFLFTAPKVAVAHVAEADGPLVGVEYAADQLARPNGKPIIPLYDGLKAKEIKDHRSAR